jgi:hypothetical protein
LDVQTLTPAKLAQFYRLTGGDYDRLFIDSPPESLSFIYQSLGCFHTLQQEKNPYKPPNIPALTPQGFVKWQTVQILLNPVEHVPYLQEAVKRFEIVNNGPGGPFPKVLPVDCLPREPDPEMTRWHERVGQKLKIELQARAAAKVESESLTDSSTDDTTDATDYFTSPISPRKGPNILPISPTHGKYRQASSPSSHSPGKKSSSSHSPGKKSPKGSRSPEWSDGPTPTFKQPYRFRESKYQTTVESDSSSSSESRSPPPRQPRSNPRIFVPESNRSERGERVERTERAGRQNTTDQSPRAYSVTRNPYSPDARSPSRDEIGRRHSSHGLYDSRRDSVTQPFGSGRAANTLSPPFFVSQNSRPVSQAGPSPTVVPSNLSPTNPVHGNYARGSLRNTISHGPRDGGSWRNKLSAYVSMAGRRRNVSDTREQDRSIDDHDRDTMMEGVRFVDGVGGVGGRERRRDPPERTERDWDTDWESRRRERRERRRSGGSGGMNYDRR